MKSFRIYLTGPIMQPERPGKQIPLKEQLELRERFHFARHRRRRFVVATACCFLAFFIAMVVGTFFGPELFFATGFIPGFVAWSAGLFCLYKSAVLSCPACGKSVFTLGSFCPECGAAGLERGSIFRGPTCHDCGKTLWCSRHHTYQTRACSHCGLLLEDDGVQRQGEKTDA